MEAIVPALDGKVAIVTGGATLIGAKIVEAFVAEGSQVVMADINADDGQAVADDLGEAVTFAHIDITDDAALDSLVQLTLDIGGGIDVLVNCAATYLDNHLETTREEWLTAFDVNVVSGALLTARVAPHMRERGGGSVVNMASIAGKRAQPLFFVYPVTKAAILGITRNQSLKLSEWGIRVNSVSPGWIWSNPIIGMTGNDRALVDEVSKAFSLPGRIGDPEEVANAVVFLASDGSSFITGTDLAVDGGYTAIGPEQMGQSLEPLLERMRSISGE
jgi:NAD(P)-dependent dehydrogenase (short-subunit alcohol dehydrogenase family)